MNQRSQVIGLIAFIMLCLGAGALGAIVTTPEIDNWYRSIQKPTWNPPDWIFGPVWSTLYLLMGIAAWIVWKPAGWKAASVPLSCFVAQLLLNMAWSWIFFGFHQLGWAVVEIIVLWLAIGTTVVSFFQRSRIAGLLLLPYWAWVSFATFLNFTIWQMNLPE